MPRSLPLARRGRLAFGEAGPVGNHECLVQAAPRIAAVVFHHDRRLVRIGLLGNHVAAADFGPIDSHVACRDVDQAFEHEGRFRPPGAAIGIDRHGVGEDDLHFAVDRRRGVDAGEQRAVEIGRDIGAEGRDVAADVGDGVDAQAEELAVFVERQFGLGDVVAALRIGDEPFAALARPILLAGRLCGAAQVMTASSA